MTTIKIQRCLEKKRKPIYSTASVHNPTVEIPTLDRRTDTAIQNIHISEEMVRRDILNLNANKSCGS